MPVANPAAAGLCPLIATNLVRGRGVPVVRTFSDQPDSLNMITTERLTLVPAVESSVRAALAGNEHLANALRAHVPPSWPPEHLDAAALEWVLRWLADPANDPQWGMYWAILRDGETGRTLIGGAGFKGVPSDGMVECGYGVAAEHRRRGYATEMVRGMVAHAFASPLVQRVTAETLPELTPSIGVLNKCGFQFIGEGSEPGTIRYELPRPPLSTPQLSPH